MRFLTSFSFFLFELILHRILFTSTWFTLSFNPFENGQSVEVKISLMLLFLAYAWISLDVSTGYRSARINFIEAVSLVESITFVISSERCIFDVNIKTALEKWSIRMCINFFGELLLEKPSTVSNDIISNGFLAGPSFDINLIGLLVLLLFLMQISHFFAEFVDYLLNLSSRLSIDYIVEVVERSDFL